MAPTRAHVHLTGRHEEEALVTAKASRAPTCCFSISCLITATAFGTRARLWPPDGTEAASSREKQVHARLFSQFRRELPVSSWKTSMWDGIL